MRQLSLREIQQAELDILTKFDEFCKNHALTYSLVGGTLLGAVRHKGFIPWDDDVDVGMPRPDYEKFVKLMQERNNKLTDDFVVIPDRGKDVIRPFLKIENKKIFFEKTHRSGADNLWIDVFPFDGCPKDKKKAEKLFKKAKHYRHIIIYNKFKISHFKGLGKLLYLVCAAYAKMYGMQRVIRNLNKLLNKYPYGEAECVAGIVWGIYGLGEVISGDSFDKIVELDFEGKHFSAIHNWDEYLSGIYGDYMTLPSEEKRKTHKLVAFEADDNLGV